MKNNYTNRESPLGITAANRERLSRLHRKASGPFSVAQAVEILRLDKDKTAYLLAYLASRGWLNRVRRGRYIVVPLDAARPSEWNEDTWIVAATLFRPCYIGGWSACEHWGLTEQIFRDVVVVTARNVRKTSQIIQGTRFRFKMVSADRMFGLATVWRRTIKIEVSDPARTIVDILSAPALGGGIRQVADVLSAYMREKIRDDQKLIQYAERLGNRTVFKRLGYLLEILQPEETSLIDDCRRRISSGDTFLDPSVKTKGTLRRRWNLWINATIRPSSVQR